MTQEISAVGNLKPVFDTTLDVVSFDLNTPMDYKVERQHVSYTNNGVQYASQQKEYSSSSSDEDFPVKRNIK